MVEAGNWNQQSAGEPLQAGTSSFDQVSLLCESFSQELDSGLSPTISNYLARVSKDDQPMLLRNLLQIEIEKQRSTKEQPQADEYIQQFPEFTTLIRHVFLESSQMSTLIIQHDTAGEKPVEFKPLVVNRLGNYQLVREIGRGGMGTVYEALHTKHGNRVALKTLPSVDGASLHRFKREFRSMADVNHPNLIGLHTLESDGSQWFFTMDLIDGG